MTRVSKEREELLTRVVGIQRDYGLFSLVNNACNNEKEVNYLLGFLNSHPTADKEDIVERVSMMRSVLTNL